MPDVFFYGLFMDRALLLTKGVRAINERKGKVEGYSLRIGKRATLVPTQDSVVYGIVMSLSQVDLDALYSDPSVSDYRSENATAQFSDGTTAPVLCFNLPIAPTAEEHNQDYADKLRALATKLELPSEYVETIK
jgi:hypothetical protein